MVSMFSTTTLPLPGRFLKARFLLPIIVFLVVVRFSLPGGGGKEKLSQWGFLPYSNQTWSDAYRTTVPDDKLKGGFDHDREKEQEPVKGHETTPVNGDETKPVEGDEKESIGGHKITEPPKKDPAIQKAVQEQEHFDKVCGGLRSGKRIVITLNTGATEILERVPTILKTSLLCAPNVHIFSDLAHTLGDRPVYDSLDTVPAEVMKGNTDFDLYRKQLELKDPVKVAEFLKGMKDPRNPDTAAAWTLDKYKKLHILEKAWALQPDMDWYFHTDADTYVIWSSLVEWLAKLDPTKELYLGSLSFINNLPFGHGGSGMLMSGAAMRNFVMQHNGTAGRWDYKMQNECCADWVLAQILKEYGMGLMNSWPTIQGEPQSTIPFDGTHWCAPLVTMHHVSPLEAQQMGDFEAKREDKTKPLTFEEVFNGLVSDLIPTQLDDWDNQALGHTEDGIQSYESCVEKCKNDHKCLQIQWKGDESDEKKCTIGTEHVMLGHKHSGGDENKRYKSYWLKERIGEWAKRQECKGPIKFPYEDGKNP